MTWEWLSGIKNISDIVNSLNKHSKDNRATKDLLIRELKLNIKAFETAQKSSYLDYDSLLSILRNERVQKARESAFTFSKIKKGNIEEYHIEDERNKRYIGKDCDWLFKNIDDKIDDLRNQQEYHGYLQNIKTSSIALQFSNLFYKMKLLADFIIT